MGKKIILVLAIICIKLNSQEQTIEDLYEQVDIEETRIISSENNKQYKIEDYNNFIEDGIKKAKNKKYDESIKLLEEAIIIRDIMGIEDFSIYNDIGWIYYLSGNNDKAIINLEKAISNSNKLSNKKGEAAFNNLGLVYLTNKDYDNAKEMFMLAFDKYNSPYAISNIELVDTIIENK